MRFFNPKSNFMKWLKEELLKHEKMPIIDCGCGDGDLVREMRTANLPAIGVDPRYYMFNETIPFDLLSAVYPYEAEHFPLLKTTPCFLLVCRPCHTGFPYLINRSRHPKSLLYYVGLKENIELDLRDMIIKLIHKTAVGLEGEQIWQCMY